jgi:hypothetical protein
MTSNIAELLYAEANTVKNPVILQSSNCYMATELLYSNKTIYNSTFHMYSLSDNLYGMSVHPYSVSVHES